MVKIPAKLDRVRGYGFCRVVRAMGKLPFKMVTGVCFQKIQDKSPIRKWV